MNSFPRKIEYGLTEVEYRGAKKMQHNRSERDAGATKSNVEEWSQKKLKGSRRLRVREINPVEELETYLRDG